jgi:hypothetical protein
MLRAAMSQKQPPRSASRFSASAQQQAPTRQQVTAQAPAAAPHTAAHHNQQQQWRLELFFKTQQDLQAQIPFLQRHGITRVNLTNKSNDDQLLQSASLLQANIAGLDLCVHYSLKYNYNRSPAATLDKLQAFHHELQHMFPQLEQEPAGSSSQVKLHQQQQCHVLLVSGGGKKKAFDTVAALQQLSQQQKQQQLCTASTVAHQSASKRQRTAARASNTSSTSSSSSSLPSFAVAFNPYLPDEAAAAQEVSRLRAKLQTGLVSRVYLQVSYPADVRCNAIVVPIQSFVCGSHVQKQATLCVSQTACQSTRLLRFLEIVAAAVSVAVQVMGCGQAADRAGEPFMAAGELPYTVP